MNLLFPMLGVAALMAVAVSAVLLVWLLRERSTPGSTTRTAQGAAAADRRQASRQTLYRLAGALIGIAATVLLLTYPVALGRLSALAPAALVIAVLVGTCLAELTAEQPHGAIRTATLRPRSLKALLPRPLAAGTVASLVLIALTLTAGTVLGSPDDLDRPGRAFTTHCVVDGYESSWRHGPWPGSFYTVPILLALVAALALAAYTLHAIVTRPVVGTEIGDELNRRRAVVDVLVSVCLLGFGSTAPLGQFMALAFFSTSCPGYTTIGFTTMLVVAVSALCALACLGWLLIPTHLVAQSSESRR